MKLYGKETPKPIMYLSGGHTNATAKQEKDWIKRSGCTHRCYAFGYTCPGAFYYCRGLHKSHDYSVDCGLGIMMDSSAYSFQKFTHSAVVKRRKGYTEAKILELRDDTVKLYIQYCKEHSKHWDWYANFDYVRHAPTVYKIQQQLEKAGLNPVPVFHGDDGDSWLKRYCEEGYKLICIGGTGARTSWRQAREYLDVCFNIAEKYNVKLHGLAVTSLSHMFSYPWYSVDSATWIKVSAFGKIIYIDPIANTLGQIHISDQQSRHNPSWNRMSRDGRRAIERQVEAYGFDFKTLQTSLIERGVYNAAIFYKHISHLKELVSRSRVSWETIL